MKRTLIYILILLALILSANGLFAQSNDATLDAQGNVIRTETIPKANTSQRIGTMFQDLVAAKMNINYGLIAAGENTYSASFKPGIYTAYRAGDSFVLNFTNPNTGPSTLNLTTIGPVAIVKNGGDALEGGELDGYRWVIYDGTNFQLASSGISESYVADVLDTMLVDPGGASNGDYLGYAGGAPVWLPKEWLPVVGYDYTNTTGSGISLTSSTLTTGNILSLSNTSSPGAGTNNQSVLSVTNSGVNSSSTQTTHAAYFSNTRTGTSSINIGLYVVASGGSLFNRAIFTQGDISVNGGDVILAPGRGVLWQSTGGFEKTGSNHLLQIATTGTSTITAPLSGTLYSTGTTDVAVADGGTGRSTGTTAYSLIATGTTATGAQQTLANGATTQILVGGGASALPVWTTATGTGAPVRSGSNPTITLGNGTGLPLTTGVTGILPVANGGTGTATPALVAGTNVSITGTWPNQTINATGGGGSGDVTYSDLKTSRVVTTTDTLVQSDQFKMVYFNSASPVNFLLGIRDAGTQVSFKNIGAGTITFTDSTGVTSTGTSTLASGASAHIHYYTSTAPIIEQGNLGDVIKSGTAADNQVAIWTGDGTIEGTSSFTYSSSTLSAAGGFDFYGAHQRIRYNESANLLYSTKLSASAASSLTVSGSPGISASPNGQTLIIDSGSGYASGNGNGGNIQFSLGSGTGTGVDGNVDIGGNPATFQGMEKGIYIRDVNTAPSGNPTGGVFVWVDNTDGKLKVLADDGETYEMVIPTSATTGAVISFTKSQVYNSDSSPSASNITDNLTGAKIGIIQKIYHENGTEPTYPAGWVKTAGTYNTAGLNIIMAEWVSGTRVEYWIIPGE